MMDWTYPARAGDAGIFEIGRRIAEQLGRMPDATNFTYDAREMLRITRRVERASKGGRLFSGFQVAKKYDLEEKLYSELAEAGTEVVVYGTGQPSIDIQGVEWRELEADTRKLENQWFLISDAPEAIAFVSWETSDPATFGVGGAATEGKRFVGFVSDDPDVVSELVRALTSVKGLPPQQKAEPEARKLSDRATGIAADVANVSAPKVDAGPGAVLVTVGRHDTKAALRTAMAIAKSEGRELVIVDRSSEGLFSSTYAATRADDELRPKPDALFDASVARREGRGETADALDAAESLGVKAGGWFANAAGADGLRTAVRQFKGALLVVPGATKEPGIGERLRGMTIANLEKLGIPVVVAA
jgi:hypothetical protein